MFLPARPFIYGGELNLRIATGSDVSSDWMVGAVIEIPDHLVIDDVEAGIRLTHTKVGDLRTLLQSPDKNKNIEEELRGVFVGVNLKKRKMEFLLRRTIVIKFIQLF